MARKDTSYPAPKKNLCIARANRPIVCKRMPAVTTITNAKRVAYRIAYKLDLVPGDKLTVRLGQGHEGQLYWFHVEHGRISCRRGTMYGPKCD